MNPWVATVKPVGWSLCSKTRDAPQWKPEHCDGEQPCEPQLEKACSKEDPAEPKQNNLSIKKLVSEESSWADMELYNGGQIPSWPFPGMQESGGCSEGPFLPELSSVVPKKIRDGHGVKC